MALIKLLFAITLFWAHSESSAGFVFRTAAQEGSEPKFLHINTAAGPAIGGVCVDIMRAIEKVSPDIQFVGDQVWMPPARIDASVKSGNIDVVCGLLGVTSNINKYHLLSTPLFEVTYLLAVRADDNLDVQTWDDIRQLGDHGVILALRGFGIVEILQQMGHLKIDASATSSRSNLKKLIARRGRFYCHRSPGIKQAIKDSGLGEQVKLLNRPQLNGKFYMALSKSIPDIQANKINAALMLLEQSGELNRIFNRYKE
ncbi:transporter substrate-binding domain-containing protein [Undibacterium sp. FT147W]|uniref:Transporter substrate-binding domain-containing protein n=1 Tax=Undibacterium rivi TaxID=2828729 RepID=A0ABS5GZ83_9BURK|nr:transporter substrate-binding domain-containing protein [Undibacterium rivi]MBR7791765.1 transporter substrate-binding domain-containing protein [Undibacterium rivi]